MLLLIKVEDQKMADQNLYEGGGQRFTFSSSMIKVQRNFTLSKFVAETLFELL